MNQPLANGVELIGARVVAADAISKLAGTNLGTTAKVLLALYAVNLIRPDLTLDALVSPEGIPSEAADDVRYDNTEEFVADLIHALQKVDHRALADRLQVHRRFLAQPLPERVCN